jgi:hypothetical protein
VVFGPESVGFWEKRRNGSTLILFVKYAKAMRRNLALVERPVNNRNDSPGRMPGDKKLARLHDQVEQAKVLHRGLKLFHNGTVKKQNLRHFCSIIPE